MRCWLAESNAMCRLTVVVECYGTKCLEYPIFVDSHA